jgi:hypothetical protein
MAEFQMYFGPKDMEHTLSIGQKPFDQQAFGCPCIENVLSSKKTNH